VAWWERCSVPSSCSHSRSGHWPSTNRSGACRWRAVILAGCGRSVDQKVRHEQASPPRIPACPSRCPCSPRVA
jgi:hypothetical protein